MKDLGLRCVQRDVRPSAQPAHIAHSLPPTAEICNVVGTLAHRGLIVVVLTAVLGASLPIHARAWPNVPMCVADRPVFSETAPTTPVEWEPELICAPYTVSVADLTPQQLLRRAVQAYQHAQELIAAAKYEEARLSSILRIKVCPALPIVSRCKVHASNSCDSSRKRPPISSGKQ